MRNSRCRCVVGDTCEAACLPTGEHVLAALSLQPDRYCVSSIDTDELRRTGKYDSYIGIRNVIFSLGVFCNVIRSECHNKLENKQRLAHNFLLTW